MMNDALDRGSGWTAIALFAAVGTVGCVVASVLLNYLLLFSETLTPFARSAITAVLVPIFVGAPLFVLLGIARRQVGAYRRALTRSATYDPLTAFYNGRVLSASIDRREPSGPAGSRNGTFLIVEVTNLKSINMRHGFRWGEEALLAVASIIRACVRSEDLVGRVGAAEFGIFLAGAAETDALAIGRRIKREVARSCILPGRAGAEATDELQVSVGGATFGDQASFDAMFRTAEEQVAKSHATDAIELAGLADAPPRGQWAN